MKPGNTHSLANDAVADLRPERFDRPNDLVPGNDGSASNLEVTLDHVQIGPTDPAGVHLDEHLIGGWRGDGNVVETQRMRTNWSRSIEDHRAHVRSLH